MRRRSSSSFEVKSKCALPRATSTEQPEAKNEDVVDAKAMTAKHREDSLVILSISRHR